MNGPVEEKEIIRLLALYELFLLQILWTWQFFWISFVQYDVHGSARKPLNNQNSASVWLPYYVGTHKDRTGAGHIQRNTLSCASSVYVSSSVNTTVAPSNSYSSYHALREILERSWRGCYSNLLHSGPSHQLMTVLTQALR